MLVQHLLDQRAALHVLARQLGEARADLVADRADARAQRVVGERGDLRLPRVDLGNPRGEPLHLPLVLGTQEDLDDLVDNVRHTHLESETVRLTARKLKPEHGQPPLTSDPRRGLAPPPALPVRRAAPAVSAAA